jgi:ubiquinone/menaquinone biosynthesis C-methylase UbiE
MENTQGSYVIRGGLEGRERLRILARVLRSAALDLLARAGLGSGMSVLDVGCGGGDVCWDLAELVGPSGKVVGIDLDEVKIDLARREAGERGIRNVEFRTADITTAEIGEQFDFVFMRFVLTHLREPSDAVSTIRRAIRPGGVLAATDIDFRGNFCYPDCPAFWRYVELYTEAVRRRGADANIGPRLPSLLIEHGFENVAMNVSNPADLKGELKLLAPITMESIADTVISAQLASPDDTARVVTELYEFARMPNTVVSLPRLVEAWGTAPR